MKKNWWSITGLTEINIPFVKTVFCSKKDANKVCKQLKAKGYSKLKVF